MYLNVLINLLFLNFCHNEGFASNLVSSKYVSVSSSIPSSSPIASSRISSSMLSIVVAAATTFETSRV